MVLGDGASALAYRSVLTSVERGLYVAGQRLPSERRLSEQLGVSRASLRSALLQLAAEGVLENSAQRGWFTRSDPLVEPPSTLQSFTEMARARGLHATARILSLRERSAELDESERLRIAPASAVLEIERVRGMNETAVCVDTAVLPLPMAAPLLHLDLENQSLYELLRDHCGVVVHRSAYAIRARAADAPTAALLGVPVGSPLLVGRETTYTAEGSPVNLGSVQYRGDAYEFQADLFRTGA
jgi:GntR family transcriptional regulator